MTDKVRFCYALSCIVNGKREYFANFHTSQDFLKARLFGRLCDLKNSKPYRRAKAQKISTEILKLVIVDPN